MTKYRVAQSWNDDARAAVNRGPRELGDFLEKDTPDRKEQYVLLLTYTYLHHRQLLYDELCRKIFEKLRKEGNTKPEHDGTNWSARSLRRRRQYAREDPSQSHQLLSFYDVFRSSLEKWQNREDTDDLQADPQFHCSPITKLIWDNGADELWNAGAVHACAEFGQHDLLRSIVSGALRIRTKTCNEPNNERAQFMFLTGPDSEYTSLGIAIRHQQLSCIAPLLEPKGVREYINQGHNVLSDHGTGVYMLHEILNWGRERIGMTKRSDTTENLVAVLRVVVQVNAELLAKHDARGTSPYRHAQALQAAEPFFDPCVAGYLREAIYSYLKRPDDIKKALYNDSGGLQHMPMSFTY
jgi:hypothetical protein